MNRYAAYILAVMFISLIVAFALRLNYLQASVLFGLIAVASAPIIFHHVPSDSLATGLLVGAAIFGSFPLKKLFQLDGFIQEVAVTLLYAGALWVIGFGWRRKSNKPR